MATTSPDNLRTPNPGDPYNLVADLATLASDTQVALNKKVSNLLTGTAAQRVAATGTATAGMLWQDTDGIKMIWRKDGAAWVPAVWRWSGTSSQRTGFTQAPDGFEWFNTTDNSEYVRLGGAWAMTPVRATLRKLTGGSTSATANNFLPLTWDAVDANIGGLFSAASPTRVTAAAPGHYLLYGSLALGSVSGAGGVCFQRNGVLLGYTSTWATGTSNGTYPRSAVGIDLAAGDYVELAAASTVASTAYGAAGAYFSVAKLT